MEMSFQACRSLLWKRQGQSDRQVWYLPAIVVVLDMVRWWKLPWQLPLDSATSVKGI